MEACLIYVWQALLVANDGVVDVGHNSEEARLMAACFLLLLQAAASLFSWYATACCLKQ